MRPATVKWIVGTVVFFLPTLSVVFGKPFFYQYLSDVFKVSLVLAAVVPPALVLTSSLKWRIAFAFGLWLLLGIQLCLILLCLLAGFRG
jgi:hypothetical protein